MDKVGANWEWPLSCLSIKSILDGDETAACRGWQEHPGGRRPGVARSVRREHRPWGQWPGLEDRVQSGSAIAVGVDSSSVEDVERGQGGMAYRLQG